MVQPTRQRPGRRGFLAQLVAGATVAAAVSPARGSGAQAQEGAITSFDHVAVPMQNTEAMIAFYRALGLQVMETDRRVSVHFGDQKINFHRPSSWQRASAASLRAPAATPPCGDFCFVWSRLGGIADGRSGSRGSGGSSARACGTAAAPSGRCRA